MKKVRDEDLQVTIEYLIEKGNSNLFCFEFDGELMVGVITQYETSTVDVFVPYAGKYYEISVGDQRSFHGCKLREYGDLS